MSLYQRTAVIIVSVLFGLVLILFVAARFIMLGSFAELERDTIRAQAQRVMLALREEPENLARLARDRAALIEAGVATTGDGGCLSAEALAILHLSFALALDGEGRLLHHTAIDSVVQTETALPGSLADPTVLALLAGVDSPNRQTVSGLLQLPEGIALVACAPVAVAAEDTGQASPRALVVGRFLRPGEYFPPHAFANATTTDYALNQPDDLPPGIREIAATITGEDPVQVRVYDQGDIAAYLILKDLRGDPVMLLEISRARDLYNQGRSALSYYVLSLLLAGLVFGLVFLVLLDKQVLARLEALGRNVAHIGSTKDFSARVGGGGADELGRLAEAINGMLGELQRAQQQIARARDELEARVEERTAELQRTQQQVIEQERMRALGQMASGIAHDFNNALATILGACELLLMMKQREGSEEGGRDREFLESIHTAARDAANAVSRLREFYRVREETEVLQRVALNHLVKQTLSMTEPMWKDQAQGRGIPVKVQTELAEPIPEIVANEAELREMLTNLIFNAIDAMPNGGTITLATRASGDTVSLMVRDQGVGMSETVRRRCLEPFFTTKGDKGTGLGLAMVHGIVRRHEGELTIDSTPDVGTTITVHLPLQRREVTIAVPPEDAVAVAPRRILLVDDVDSVRRMIRAYLVQDGHQVVEADNGRVGLDLFLAGEFDLVITDRGMPEMSGDQLAVALRQRAPDLPIVMLTGFGEMMRSAGEQPEGVTLVVSKPVTVGVLRRALSDALGEGRAAGSVAPA